MANYCLVVSCMGKFIQGESSWWQLSSFGNFPGKLIIGIICLYHSMMQNAPALFLFLLCFFSDELIGTFETTVRKLSKGPCDANKYEVS